MSIHRVALSLKVEQLRRLAQRITDLMNEMQVGPDPAGVPTVVGAALFAAGAGLANMSAPLRETEPLNASLYPLLEGFEAGRRAMQQAKRPNIPPSCRAAPDVKPPASSTAKAEPTTRATKDGKLEHGVAVDISRQELFERSLPFVQLLGELADQTEKSGREEDPLLYVTAMMYAAGVCAGMRNVTPDGIAAFGEVIEAGRQSGEYSLACTERDDREGKLDA